MKIRRLTMASLLILGLIVWARPVASQEPARKAMLPPLAKDTNTLARELFGQAESLLQEGKYDKALKAFKQITFLSPEDAAAQYHLALTYIKLERYPEAVKACRQHTRSSHLAGNTVLRRADCISVQSEPDARRRPAPARLAR